MMRHLTDEEKNLMEKLHSKDSLSEEEKAEIIKRLKEIEAEETEECSFCH